MYFLSQPSKLLSIAVTFIVIAITTDSAIAQSKTVYGVSPGGFGTPEGVGAFWMHDPETLQQIQVGNTGFLVTALAYDPRSDIFYAVDGVNIGSADLWRIDKATGVATKIGPVSMSGTSVQGLAYDYVTNVLYGVDVNGFDPGGAGRLITIDPSNGSTTDIGPFDPDSSLGEFEAFVDLAIDTQSGVLYSTGGHSSSRFLVRIDKGTGNADLVGSFIVEATGEQISLFNLSFDPESSALIAIQPHELVPNDPDPPIFIPPRLVSINPISAGVTYIGDIFPADPRFDGKARNPSSIAYIAPPPDNLFIVTHGWQRSGVLVGLPEVVSALEDELNRLGIGGSSEIIEFKWQEAVTDSLDYFQARAHVDDAGARLAVEIERAVQAGRAKSSPEYDPAIHFIGHSLGTLVNAEAVSRLPNDISVEQVTILDSPLSPDSTLYGVANLIEHEEYFYDRMPKGSARYVENYWVGGFPVLPNHRFGQPITGTGPCRQVEQEFKCDGIAISPATHEDIHSNFYSALVRGLITDPTGSAWTSPFQPGWQPEIEWDPDAARINRQLFTVDVKEYSPVRAGVSLVPLAGFAIEDPPDSGRYSLRTSSPAAIGGVLTIPANTLSVKFNYGLVDNASGRFDVYLDDTRIWTSTVLEPREDNALVSLTTFAGQTGTLRWELNPLTNAPSQGFVSDIRFAIANRFSDVDLTYWAYSFIDKLAASGVTSGCGNGEIYCPEDPVTRAQMAVFLERGIRGSDFIPPPASGSVFSDVAAGDFAAAWIEQLYADGITAGCGNNNYCPSASVTRDQMAVFLLRAKYGPSYAPPHATGIFNDVDLNYWAVRWVEQLAAEGITAGCGNGNYCPEAPVTRAQMAVFLVRTFGL